MTDARNESSLRKITVKEKMSECASHHFSHEPYSQRTKLKKLQRKPTKYYQT